MRIAQVAQLFEAIPPPYYGGTERVVSWLTESLVGLGHDVTLFASGDSVTAAKLKPVIPRAIRGNPDVRDWLPLYINLLETVRREADSFDIIHFHIDSFPLSLFTRQATPFVLTMHGRLDLPEYSQAYGLFPDAPLVSISHFQRRPLPNQNWAANIQHGLPANRLRPMASERSCLVFIGRISPEKGIDAAIRIARQAGVKLKIAAKVDKVDEEYFEAAIKPQFDPAAVEFVGEIGDDAKSEFFKDAIALLFPIDWPESFGLVMIEAMACGVPVIGYNRASVPEVLDEGLTGFVVSNETEAVAAVARARSIDRAAIRAQFEKRFTDTRMASDYVTLYQDLIDARAKSSGAGATGR